MQAPGGAEGTFPVQYLGANVPQGMGRRQRLYLLRAILGLDANAQKKQLIVDPVLPPWLPDITIRNLRVGKATIDLRFWREGDMTRYNVLSVDGELSVSEPKNGGPGS